MKRARPKSPTRFVLCIDVGECPASLERLKLYEMLPDPLAETHRLVRVIDESGEDYLYAARYFRRVTLSPALHRQVTGRAAPVTGRRPAAIR